MSGAISRKLEFWVALALLLAPQLAHAQPVRTTDEDALVAINEEDATDEDATDDWEAFAEARRGGLNFIYLEVGVAVQRFDFNRVPLSNQDDVARPKLLLDGSGWAAGFQLRGGYQNDWGLRFGVTGGMRAVARPQRVKARFLREETELNSLTIGNFGVSVGKAFDAVYLYPYLDLEAAISIGNAELADGATGDPVLYAALAPSVAARAGAIVPFSDVVYLDASARYDFAGLGGGFGGHLGIGILAGPSSTGD